jgi:hypothetical protein
VQSSRPASSGPASFCRCRAGYRALRYLSRPLLQLGVLPLAQALTRPLGVLTLAHLCGLLLSFLLLVAATSSFASDKYPAKTNNDETAGCAGLDPDSAEDEARFDICKERERADEWSRAVADAELQQTPPVVDMVKLKPIIEANRELSVAEPKSWWERMLYWLNRKIERQREEQSWIGQGLDWLLDQLNDDAVEWTAKVLAVLLLLVVAWMIYRELKRAGWLNGSAEARRAAASTAAAAELLWPPQLANLSADEQIKRLNDAMFAEMSRRGVRGVAEAKTNQERIAALDQQQFAATSEARQVANAADRVRFALRSDGLVPEQLGQHAERALSAAPDANQPKS